MVIRREPGGKLSRLALTVAARQTEMPQMQANKPDG